MSQYEHRFELWNAAQAAIDAASDDLDLLIQQLAEEEPEERVAALAKFAEEYAFEIDRTVSKSGAAFTATARHFNAEDMRKGLQHGRVAVVASGDAEHPSDLAAAVATVIGLAATLVKMYGQVSLLVVERTSDLLAFADDGFFSQPDCVFTFRASDKGLGFQHTIMSSGNYLAGASLNLVFEGGSGTELRELHTAVGALFDDLEESETLTATGTGFEIHAPRSSRVQEIVSQISALARARAESNGLAVEVQSEPLLVEMLPSRILARRVKTFGDTLEWSQDPIQKLPAGTPTLWGPVSHEVATAIIGYPIFDGDNEVPTDLDQALNVAKAVTGAGLDVLGDMEFRGFVEGERIRALRERDIARTPRRWLGVHPILPPKEGQRRRSVHPPDVVVRGPGLPEPSLEDFEDDESS